VKAANLVHSPCRGQHPDHARITRVDVREHQIGARGKFRGDKRQVRETPNSIVEDGRFDARLQQPPPFPLRDFRVPDNLLPRYDFIVSRSFQPRPKLVLKFNIHLAQHVVGELPPVGKS